MKRFDYTPQSFRGYHEAEKTNSERILAEALDLQGLEERALDQNALPCAKLPFLNLYKFLLV